MKLCWVLSVTSKPRGGKFRKLFENFKEKMESSLEVMTEKVKATFQKLSQILFRRPIELIRRLLLQAKQVLVDLLQPLLGHVD